MKKAEYANYEHYIKEGWSPQPKESFKALARIVEANAPRRLESYLDVGCATGELIGFMTSQFPQLRATGWDVFDPLLDTARRLLPDSQFARVDATQMDRPESKYDLVTAIGVMSIFDEEALTRFWTNHSGCLSEEGLLVVLSPLNEHGCDVLVQHRKRKDGKPGAWEKGWNVYSFETIREITQPLGLTVDFVPFNIGIDLKPAADPVRTYTMQTEKNPRQLVNGLKLMINHYYMIAKKGTNT
jgi:SAM-dependent methyltransferase